jgi:hypothetical protein
MHVGQNQRNLTADYDHHEKHDEQEAKDIVESPQPDGRKNEEELNEEGIERQCSHTEYKQP